MDTVAYKKRKLLIYSDCFTYSGSENVIENILKSTEISRHYDVVFYYAQNRNYEEGIKRKFSAHTNVHPVRIFSSYNHLGHFMDHCRKTGKTVTLSMKMKYAGYAFFEKTGMAHVCNVLSLYRIFKKEAPHLLYINAGGYPAAASSRLAVISAKLAGVKHVLFNVNNIAFPTRNVFAKMLDGFVGKQVKGFITASKAAGQALIRARNFNSAKLIQIPNTLSKAAELELPQVKGKLRTEFGIEGGELVLGTVGLLTNRKGFHVLIDAVELVKKGMDKGFKLFIFGEGEDRRALEEQVKLKKLDNVIFLPGFRDNILSYSKDMDLFLLPSIANEDFPYVIVEAMALGKPVLGTDIAGIPEQIDHMKTGVVVPAGNPHELAQGIEKLIARKEQLAEMGRAGQIKYQNQYSNGVIMGKYLSLFNSIQ